MTFEIPVDKNEYRSVWDKPLPIVTVNSKYYRVYILDEIGHMADYGELLDLLADLDEDSIVEFHLNTPGGVLDTASMIMDAIKNCKAKTIGKLSGTVASAGTMLALVMDEIYIAPFAAFMIHAWSGGSSGKANEIKAQQSYMEKETKKLFQVVYGGFLTPREINKILAGTDMWMNKEEVEKRLNNCNKIV